MSDISAPMNREAITTTFELVGAAPSPFRVARPSGRAEGRASAPALGGAKSKEAEMTQALDTKVKGTESEEPTLTYRELRRHGVQETERLIEPFVSELRRMTPEERIRASRYTMNRRERTVYAARYPDEVPTVNGELEWIALFLP